MEIYANCTSGAVFENGTAVLKSVWAQKLPAAGLTHSRFLSVLEKTLSWYQKWKLRYIRLLQPYYVVTKLNSVALVRERTIPTERLPPVGEVSANFCG